MPSLYIDGEWVASANGECSPVVNPSDASVVTEVDVATDEQVQAAIAAARRAFDETDWPRTPTGERAALLDRVAGLIDRDLEELARLETVNTGKAMRESRWDMSDVARVFRYYADLADKDAGRLVDTGNPDAVSRIVYEPVGVCGLIGPWNYPLLQLSWKIAPALAAGNTAVMKPAQVTPLTAIHLTRLFEEAGVPGGGRQSRARSGRARRAGAGRQPRRRPRVADRRARGGPGGPARRGGQSQEGRARDGRQEPEHRVRRRRLRDRRRQRPDRRVHPLGPGLLGRLPGDRPGHDLRPIRRGGRPAGGPDPARPRQRRRDRSRGAHHRRATAPRSRASSRAPSPRAPGSSPVAAARPSPSSRPASSTGRRSSPTSPARCASSARRSSGRS